MYYLSSMIFSRFTLRTALTAHTAPVTSCALNNDETMLVTVSRDTVRIHI